jgi:hypothetical protein
MTYRRKGTVVTANTWYTAASLPRLMGSSTADRSRKYATKISKVSADRFILGSAKVHQAPQVNRAHREPVINPQIPNTTPTLV